MIIWIWIVIALAGLFVLLIIVYFNRFAVLGNRIKSSLAQIDVQLTRRADLVPNLISTVKGYAKHEKTIFLEVTKARSALLKAETIQDKVKAGNELQKTLKSLFAVAENYPNLKANENFLHLQQELSAIEDKVAYSRQFYNDSVLDFNNIVTTFPGSMFASIFNKQEQEFLKIPSEARVVPKVSFE